MGTCYCPHCRTPILHTDPDGDELVNGIRLTCHSCNGRFRLYFRGFASCEFNALIDTAALIAELTKKVRESAQIIMDKDKRIDQLEAEQKAAYKVGWTLLDQRLKRIEELQAVLQQLLDLSKSVLEDNKRDDDTSATISPEFVYDKIRQVLED